MDISEVFKNVKVSYKLSDFEHISILKDEKKKEKLEKEIKITKPLKSYDELVTLTKHLEIKEDNLFIVKSGFFDVYCYLDLNIGTYVNLYDANIDTIKGMYIDEIIETQDKILREQLKEEDYLQYFITLDSKMKNIMLNKLYFKIETEKERLKVFEHTYSSMEYGFDDIDENIYKDIKRITSKNIIKERDKTLTIYRGQTEKSTAINIAHSWTTNKKYAEFFASRFSPKNPKIYKAEIDKKDIIAHINNRGEDEVLVDFKDLKNIKEMEM